MARIRSPNYPSMSLPDALKRIELIHKAEQHLAAPREVMAKHLGFNGLNGSSLKAISALLKYGLLEKTKDDKLKVSQLAMQVLHPRSEDEKREALGRAATKPSLFVEVANEWPDGVPSDDNLRSFLIRRNFAADAIPEVIRSYRGTVALIAPESGVYSSLADQLDEDGGDESEETPQLQSDARPQQTQQSPPKNIITGINPTVIFAAGESDSAISIKNDRIEFVGVVYDQIGMQKVIDRLAAVKAILPEKWEGTGQPSVTGVLKIS